MAAIGPLDDLDDDVDELPDSPPPVVKLLGWLILACLVVAAVLGMSKRGEPIWKPARALFLPAGVLMILQSTLLEGRRAHPWTAIAPTRLLPPSLFICGIGLGGFGLEELDPDGDWLLLAIPMIVLLGLLFLREAIRGNDS